MTERSITIAMAGNAFLRAYRAVGVPIRMVGSPGSWAPTSGVAGQWYIDVREPVVFTLRLQCEECQKIYGRVMVATPVVRDFSAKYLLVKVQAAADYLAARGCTHMNVLLDASTPSEEVIAIAELELLAGGE